MKEHKSETVTIEKATLWKIVAGVFFLLFVITLINGGILGNKQPAPAAQPTAGDETPTVSVDMKKIVDDDAVLGKADAPITIVEFSDYQCPYCKRHFDATEAQIITNYVNTGKVKLVYRDFPLSFHQNAEKAAEASECAHEQGEFWKYHDILFKYSQGDGTGLSDADLKKYAQDAGLDTTKFNACLDSGLYAPEVSKDAQDGGSLGVQGTPGFFIGKTNGNSAQMISGAYPYATFKQVIDEELAK